MAWVAEIPSPICLSLKRGFVSQHLKCSDAFNQNKNISYDKIYIYLANFDWNWNKLCVNEEINQGKY